MRFNQECKQPEFIQAQGLVGLARKENETIFFFVRLINLRGSILHCHPPVVPPKTDPKTHLEGRETITDDKIPASANLPRVLAARQTHIERIRVVQKHKVNLKVIYKSQNIHVMYMYIHTYKYKCMNINNVSACMRRINIIKLISRRTRTTCFLQPYFYLGGFIYMPQNPWVFSY